MSDEQTARTESEIDSGVTGGYDRLIGTVINGKYRIIQRLGHGGMGAVYKAEHLLIERTVAIKILHSYLAESPEYLQRFKREASIASKLVHPNAITLYDYGIEEQSPYLIMQYVEGRTLHSILSNEGPLSLDRTAHLLAQIGESVEEAHNLGIIHRDLKPDNIMVANRPDGTETVWVLDFGIAKPSQSTGDSVTSRLTQVGMFMGTPQYMSPEQALMSEIDARSDLYSIGIIAYEMLTGKVPFSSKSPVELLFKHVNEIPIPIREFRPDSAVPQRVSDVVMKALAKNPQDRFQSVREFVTAFNNAVSASMTPQQVKSPKFSAKALIGGGATALVMIGLTVFVSTTRYDKSATSEPVIKAAAQQQNNGPREGEAAIPSVTAVPLTSIAPASPTTSPVATAVAPAVVEPSTPASVTQTVESAASLGSQPYLGTTTREVTPDSPPKQEVAPADPVSLGVTLESMVPESLNSQLNSEQRPTPDSQVEKLLVTPPQQQLSDKAAKAQLAELYSAGQKLLAEQKYIEAGGKFQEALSIRANHLPALLSLGVCLLRLGYSEEAKTRFDHALSLNPKYAPTLYNIASYYAHQGDVTQTINYLTQAATLYPKIRTWLKDDPDFENVRSDSQFQQFLE